MKKFLDMFSMAGGIGLVVEAKKHSQSSVISI